MLVVVFHLLYVYIIGIIYTMVIFLLLLFILK